MDTPAQANTDTSAPKPAESTPAAPAQQSSGTTPPPGSDQKPPTPPSSSPPSSTQPDNSSPEKKGGSPKKILSVLLGIVLLLIGLGAGYVAAGSKPAEENKDKSVEVSEEITLPPDAVQIQACANNKGALFVKPENIPVGPIYMVHNKKVIGIEFMLGKDEFIAGKSFKFLSAFSVKVDHVNLGLLSQGHEGFPSPHYHVDLYLVDKNYESKITCPNAAVPSQIPSPGVSVIPSGIIPSVAVTQTTQPSPTPTIAPSVQP